MRGRIPETTLTEIRDRANIVEIVGAHVGLEARRPEPRRALSLPRREIAVVHRQRRARHLPLLRLRRRRQRLHLPHEDGERDLSRGRRASGAPLRHHAPGARRGRSGDPPARSALSSERQGRAASSSATSGTPPRPRRLARICKSVASGGKPPTTSCSAMRRPAATSWRVACVTPPAAIPSSASEGRPLVARATARVGRRAQKRSRSLRSLPGASHVPDHRLGRPRGGLREPRRARARSSEDAKLPKYLNSPETPLYRKGSHLYGLAGARDAMRKSGRAVVVEGYFDVLALAEAGISHVVASLGTALTLDQLHLLAALHPRHRGLLRRRRGRVRAPPRRASPRFSRPGSGAMARFSRRATIPTRSCSARVGTPRSRSSPAATPLLDFYLDRADSAGEHGRRARRRRAASRGMAPEDRRSVRVRHDRPSCRRASARAGGVAAAARGSATATASSKARSRHERRQHVIRLEAHAPLTSDRRRKRRVPRSCS